MNTSERMVDGYEIKHAIYIGNKEILFGMDETKADCPYMVCDCTWDNPFGIDQYDNAVGSTDYFEMMTEFLSRAHAQMETVKAERVQTLIPIFTKEHCIPNDYSQNIENKVVVIRHECLLPEYRSAVKQLVLATGGFGTLGNARGRAVYTVNLYTGKEARWNREDILGVLKPEYMPEWAAEKLKQSREKQQNKHDKSRKDKEKEMNDLTRYKLCAGLTVPAAAKLIYYYLLDKSNGRSIAISVKQIGKNIGLSHSATRRNLHRLKRMDMLDIAPRYSDDGGRLSNRYRLK